jgi:outer membrane protein assembly factor BamB
VRKAPIFFLALLSFCCAISRTKIKPYPTGVIFPLEEVGQVVYEGKLISALVKGEDGRLYFSTDKGHLYCLDGTAQQLSWHQANPSPFGCPPLLGPDRIFVWDKDNNVLCFDRNGNPVWKENVSDKISSPISRDQERIYMGTEAGNLLALSQATGELLWRFETKGAVAAAAVFYGDSIILGSGDGSVYLLNSRGVRRGAIDLGSPITVAPLVNESRLYVGAEDYSFHCYDLRAMKRKWKIKAGGRLLVSPSADQKRVYLQASNNVLYALDKKRGDILWWWIAPSRSSFELGFDGQKILATLRSPLLFSLDPKSGKVIGEYDAKTEIRSNPVWADPNLVFATFDSSADRGIISFLRKELKAGISSSLSSPQPAGTEVTFTATATGFHLPMFEFYLRQGEEKTVVQKASETKTWVWFPEKEGAYAVGVRINDERQAADAEIPFEIAKKEQQK